MCKHGTTPRPGLPCMGCTLQAELDYYEARANRALDARQMEAHEHWARKYHRQLDLISNRNVATAARTARQAATQEA